MRVFSILVFLTCSPAVCLALSVEIDKSFYGYWQAVKDKQCIINLIREVEKEEKVKFTKRQLDAQIDLMKKLKIEYHFEHGMRGAARALMPDVSDPAKLKTFRYKIAWDLQAGKLKIYTASTPPRLQGLLTIHNSSKDLMSVSEDDCRYKLVRIKAFSIK